MKDNNKIYYYIGPSEIKNLVVDDFFGSHIKTYSDLEIWFNSNADSIETNNGIFILTFIIDINGCFVIADRHIEHVRCSGGKPVLSAGEVSFIWDKNSYKIAEITNQSTGFCPDSSSWAVVKDALDKIPLQHPDRFTTEFIIRKCDTCSQINIIKDSYFVCGVCGSELNIVDG
ncbi:MAG TPA: hypothetical protein VF941_12580 [Clostridia bacterium]